VIPNPWVILGAAGASLALIIGAYFYGCHHTALRYEAANARALVAAKDQAAANQKAMDDEALIAAKKFWDENPKIVTQTETVTKWAIRNVKDTAGCPTPELISVYNSSITGADPVGQVESAAGAIAGPMPVKNGP